MSAPSRHADTYMNSSYNYTNREGEGERGEEGVYRLLDASSPLLLEGPLFAVGDEGVEGQGLQQTLEHCMEVT